MALTEQQVSLVKRYKQAVRKLARAIDRGDDAAALKPLEQAVDEASAACRRAPVRKERVVVEAWS